MDTTKAVKPPSIDASCYTIRDMVASDAEQVVEKIRGLAIYEGEEDQVKITPEMLQRDLEQARFHCFVVESRDDGSLWGYALYFYIYSTWEGTSLYLEDLYVDESRRGFGIGTALMKTVAERAQRENCARWQWQCIDWNQKSMDFYTKRLGARERVETGGAKWVNMIMSPDEIKSFVESCK